jgi:uncharacterized membrane protein
MGQVWLVLAIVAGLAVLALLHFIAAGLKDVTYIHDMRVKVASLRKERLERIAAAANQETIEVGEADVEKAA